MNRLIIHPLRFQQAADQLTVSAQVTTPELFPQMPRSLWYRFPSEYRDFVGERLDGQVVGLFLVAMFHGLDLEVCGPMSARLWQGLHELQKILVRLVPSEVKPITIHAPELVSAAQFSELKGSTWPSVTVVVARLEEIGPARSASG